MTPICNISFTVQKPCYKSFPNKDDKTLGAELKRRRLALEWTQGATAKHFGVLKDSYQNWEWNKYLPHIKNRKQVVEFLGYNYWDNESHSLVNRILLHRIEHKLTMKNLAKKIKINARTIERIENNEKNVSMEMKDYILKKLF